MSDQKPNAIRLLRETWREWQEDEVPRVAAALAYYTVFSIAPLLLVLVAVAGIVWSAEAARGEIVAGAGEFIGRSGAEAVQEMIRGSSERDAGLMAIGIGLLGLLIGASSAAMHLKQSLNIIWELPPRKTGGLLGTVRSRVFSLTIVLAIGFLLMSSLVVSTAIAAVGKHIAGRLRGGELLWQLLDVGLSVAVITLLFAGLFKFLPDVRIQWRDVWTGAFFTALLFVIGKVVLGIYIGRKSFDSTFGAAASFMVLLVWIYYSSLILFFGAEFTQVHAKAHGRSPQAWRDSASGSPLPAAHRATHRPEAARRTGAAIPLVGGMLMGVALAVLGALVTAAVALLRLARRALRLG